MKKIKMLLIILCIAIMLFGFMGCKKDSTYSNHNTNGSNGSNIVATNSTSGADVPVVPEPATLILLGAGLVGLAGVGRKKFFKKD